MLRILLEEQRGRNQSLEIQNVSITYHINILYLYFLLIAFKDDVITIQHISLAISGVYNNRVAHCIEELPLQQKATVATLVVMSHQKENHVTLEKVCMLYICIQDRDVFMYWLTVT